MRDLHNNINPLAVAVATVTDNSPIVSGIVDRQGFESLEYLIAAGTIADANATFTVLVEEGDDAALTDAAAVSDQDLLGTELMAAFTFADDNEARKIGYKGNKRYTRCTVTPAENAAGAPIAIVPLLGHPNNAPTAALV